MERKFRVFVGLMVCLTPLLADAVELSSGQHRLEYHGYFRGGIGVSDQGKTQARFIMPGARGKYRLGNEPETNMELAVLHNYQLQDAQSPDANITTYIMLDGFKSHGESSDFTVDNLAQGYLSFNNMLGKGLKVWVGRRYYERKSIHILNHYWLNPGQNSQAAAGVEDVGLGLGALNLALFRNEDNVAGELINASVLDARWHGLKITGNTSLTVWGQYALRSKQENLGLDQKTGFGAGFWLNYQAGKTTNTLASIYQSGAAVPQGDFNPRPVREDQNWNLAKAETLEFNNEFFYEASPLYSVQWVLVWRREDHGQPNNSKVDWYSTGFRGIYYLSNHLNLALESGIDYVDDEINNRKGSMTKETVALQIAAGRGFKKRPVLRFFLTLAQWDDDFKGVIGNTPGQAPYGDNTDGWTIGSQLETWW